MLYECLADLFQFGHNDAESLHQKVVLLQQTPPVWPGDTQPVAGAYLFVAAGFMGFSAAVKAKGVAVVKKLQQGYKTKTGDFGTNAPSEGGFTYGAF